MDTIWTPWRYSYMTTAARQTGCIFCEALKAKDDAGMFILHRATHNFVMLNRYPYTNGHLMVAPIAHGGDLAKLPEITLNEMMMLAQKAQKAIQEVYTPDGFNLGMNLGRAAGAGVTDHVHLHVLPRWSGDTPFITTTGETRILPEDLTETYAKLAPFFSG